MSSSASRLRIVVLGYVVRGPLGGMAWHHVNYALGLKSLGHDVLFLEDSDDYPSCYDPTTHEVGVDPAYGLQFAEQTFRRLDMAAQWAYYDQHANRWHGGAAGAAASFCQGADLLLNVSGVNPLRDWTGAIGRRAFVDTDPVFTQVRHLADPERRRRAALHNAFFSFGESLGTTGYDGPTDGFPWQPTRQPVALSAWPAAAPRPQGRLTTVMQWDSYPPLEYGGRSYGMKSASFAEFLELPQRVGAAFELALGSASAPRELLQRHGWGLVDPLEVTRDPWTYQEYIRESKAEFSVAKHGYVAARSGWFSERSACYLASGRPVVVEDTGFSRHLPAGRGVLPFSDLASAEQAVGELSADYDEHCRAARDIAAEYFDARVVLGSLVERAMNG